MLYASLAIFKKKKKKPLIWLRQLVKFGGLVFVNELCLPSQYFHINFIIDDTNNKGFGSF